MARWWHTLVVACAVIGMAGCNVGLKAKDPKAYAGSRTDVDLASLLASRDLTLPPCAGDNFRYYLGDGLSGDELYFRWEDTAECVAEFTNQHAFNDPKFQRPGLPFGEKGVRDRFGWTFSDESKKITYALHPNEYTFNNFVLSADDASMGVLYVKSVVVN
jgi:hypothetical protein